MAVITVKGATNLFTLFCCDQCGGDPAHLTGADGDKDPFALSDEHNKATGHKSYTIVTSEPGLRAAHRIILQRPT
jgi:hypothetical protein